MSQFILILILTKIRQATPKQAVKTYLMYKHYTANVLFNPCTSALRLVIYSFNSFYCVFLLQSRSSRSSCLPSGLRLLLRPRFRPPAPFPRPGFPGGGRTKAKSTEMVCSRSFWLCAPSMAARASSSVVNSMRAYP